MPKYCSFGKAQRYLASTLSSLWLRWIRAVRAIDLSPSLVVLFLDLSPQRQPSDFEDDDNDEFFHQCDAEENGGIAVKNVEFRIITECAEASVDEAHKEEREGENDCEQESGFACFQVRLED